MKLIIAQSYEDASSKVADLITAQVLLNPKSIIGVATGSTPLGAYKELVKRNQNGVVSFAEASTYNLDEYIGMPRENEQSYYHYMRKNFFDHLDIREENTHLPNGSAPDPDKEAANYEGLIQQSGGIDMQLLGIGNNGHIGFNEPSDEISNDTHAVALAQSTIEANKRFFEKVEDVPRRAISMGIGTILRAKKIIMIITGAGKAEALETLLFGPITPQFPASFVRLHGDVTLVIDHESMELVKDRL